MSIFTIEYGPSLEEVQTYLRLRLGFLSLLPSAVFFWKYMIAYAIVIGTIIRFAFAL
jgi:hypothetical protein